MTAFRKLAICAVCTPLILAFEPLSAEQGTDVAPLSKFAIADLPSNSEVLEAIGTIQSRSFNPQVTTMAEQIRQIILNASISRPNSVLISNFSNTAIMTVYVSNVGLNSWREDLLGSSVITPGQAVSVSTDVGEGYCRYDVMIIDRNGEKRMFLGVDTCDGGSVIYGKPEEKSPISNQIDEIASDIVESMPVSSESFRCRRDLELCTSRYPRFDCELIMIVCLASVLLP